MAAIIKCEDSIKKDMKDYLLKEIGSLMESIRESVDAVVISEFEGGLEITFPIGEIYGYSADYVQNISYIFKELKKKYGDIAIHGIAYEFETITAATFGPFFYCEAGDTDLTITFDWQECACCGKIVENDTFYNSSQKDFGEGNLLCLCSPTCMLEYSLDKNYGELEPNGSFDEDEMDVIYDSDDEDKALKKMLWKRITLNLDEYAEDFSIKRDRVLALTNKKGITATRKKVIMSILEDMKDLQSVPHTSKVIEEIDSTSSMCKIISENKTIKVVCGGEDEFSKENELFDDDHMANFEDFIEVFAEAEEYEYELSYEGILPNAPLPDASVSSLEGFPRIVLKAEEGDERAIVIIEKIKAANEMEP